MRALWLENLQASYRTDLPIPSPGQGEALVKVSLAGVCSTDLELLRGYYPYCGIPGHEFVGIVVESPWAPEWISQRVVGEINIACGSCPPCLAGNPTHCAQRKVLGIRSWQGAFAEYLILPVQNLHLVPPGVPDESAVFTEPLAAALEVLEQVPVSRGERCLVVGAGRLGQMIAQVLATRHCSLSVVARHPLQRALLEARNIAWVAEDGVEAGSTDMVVEATGTPMGFAQARMAVRPRGTIVLKSTYKGEMTVNFSDLVVDEITLVGSRCGPFEPALRLLEHGAVDPTGLIQASYPLEQGLNALKQADQPGVLKILINPQGNQVWIRAGELP